MVKLDFGLAFYLDGFECELEDIEKIINERNDLREEKQKFYDFINNEDLLKQIYIFLIPQHLYNLKSNMMI